MNRSSEIRAHSSLFAVGVRRAMREGLRRTWTALVGARRPLIAGAVLALLSALPGGPTAAQEVARVVVEVENFRAEPMGTILARVHRGAEMPVLERQGRWRRVRLSGFVWIPSVSPATREGADLVVSRDGGENLREVPDGRILARMREGMLLRRVGREGNWYRVEREAWIWAPSVREYAADGGEGVAAGGGATGSGADPDASAGSGTPAGGERGAVGSAGGAAERLAVGSAATSLRAVPGGDTVAVARPGAPLRVLDRRGEWIRVQLDGWVRTPSLVTPDSAAVTSRLTPVELRENPGEYRGRRVRWRVRFLSLERAEAARTDFYEGEPFLLARPVDGEEGFVYLAVPPDLLDRVKRLEPLQAVEVVARVRTGSSSLTGVPILDLLTLYAGGG